MLDIDELLFDEEFEVLPSISSGGSSSFGASEALIKEEVQLENAHNHPIDITTTPKSLPAAPAPGAESRSKPIHTNIELKTTILSTAVPTSLTTNKVTITLPLWETSRLSPKLPSWLKEYCVWHGQQRQTLNISNWESPRFLIMSCRRGQKCGGTADRLRTFLALLRLAADTDRIFMIHWDRHNPALLEQFLLPPQGGLDWRAPEWLLEEIQFSTLMQHGNLKRIVQTAQGKQQVLGTMYQSPFYGAPYYDKTINATSKHELFMNETFAYAWRLLFTPVPPIAQRIEAALDDLQLVPGHYSSVHVRTYSIEPGVATLNKNQENSTIDLWHRMVHNSVRCGGLLQPGGPLYFASDARNASLWAIDYVAASNATVTVKARPPDPEEIVNQMVHLGFASSSSNATSDDGVVSALYEIFVDLYLLSMGRCVTWGGGGFGQWAYLLSSPYADSSNSVSCGFRHGKRGRHCGWEEVSNPSLLGSNESTRSLPVRNKEEPLFTPPMVGAPL